jgi:outer membrane protein assembly factor BamB
VHFLEGLHLDEPVNLWIAMLIVTLIGTIWAWRRHLAAVQAQAELTAFNPAQPTMLPFFRSQTTAPSGIAEQPTASSNLGCLPPLPSIRTSGTQLVLAEAPRRGEHIALWVISFIGFLGAAYCGMTHTSVLSQPWITLLVMWIGIWCGTLYAAYLGVTQFTRSSLRTGLPLEGVILLVMTIAGATFAGSFGSASAADPDAGISVLAGPKGSEDEVSGIVARGVAWKFQAPGKGFIDSTPLVDTAHDRVYVAVATNTLIKQSGMLYCLGKTVNEQSGREEWKVVWKFDNDGQMKQVFCSPCLANGKIYIGEGLHQDSNCMMFCLDAATGREVWQFRTDSHTESSPCYWDGKLYFGAGDDGMYCVDAETGEKMWNYQVDSDDIEKRLHIDANPTVVDGRVYCSSGVGDRGKTTAVFCINAVNGKEIWRHATDLPVWGGSVVDGDRVYFGLGNEGYVAEQENPEGALLCVDRKTGEKIWRFNTKGAVLGRAAIDGQHVFFGSRDEFFYCLDRTNGDIVWKQNLGSPVVVSPSLVAVQCSTGQSPLCIYSMNDTGKLFCLNPADGEALWTFDAIKASGIKPSESYPPQFLSSPSVAQAQADKGVKHRIHFGCGIGDDFGYKAVFFCFEAEVGIAPHLESHAK